MFSSLAENEQLFLKTLQDDKDRLAIEVQEMKAVMLGMGGAKSYGKDE